MAAATRNFDVPVSVEDDISTTDTDNVWIPMRGTAWARPRFMLPPTGRVVLTSDDEYCQLQFLQTKRQLQPRLSAIQVARFVSRLALGKRS
jgi:hypothetical protein